MSARIDADDKRTLEMIPIEFAVKSLHHIYCQRIIPKRIDDLKPRRQWSIIIQIKIEIYYFIAYRFLTHMIKNTKKSLPPKSFSYITQLNWIWIAPFLKK